MRLTCLGLGLPEDMARLRHAVALVSRDEAQQMTLEGFQQREKLLYRMRQGSYDIVVVALRGALGMESALGVRELDQRVPLVWISDDKVFALQGYRLGAQMFLCFPVTEQEIADALQFCFGNTN